MIWPMNGTVGFSFILYPDSKVHGAYMGPTWGRQDPGGPHVGHMNLAIRVYYTRFIIIDIIYTSDALVEFTQKFW